MAKLTIRFGLILALLTSSAAFSQKKNRSYDSTLARSLNADKYGMKKYILVILKTGANKSEEKAFVSAKFKGHLENIDRLVKEKKLIVAGPLAKNDKSYRGIFILDNVATPEEAQKLLQTDPAIAAGLLEPEIYTWHGSAALPVYLETSDRIWEESP